MVCSPTILSLTDAPDSDPAPDPGASGSGSTGGVRNVEPSKAAVDPSSSSSSSSLPGAEAVASE